MGRHGSTHDFHAEEEQAKAHQGLAQAFDTGPGNRHLQNQSEYDADIGVVRQLEGHQLHGEGGAEVSAEHGGNRLRKVHQAGVDETDEHDRGSGGMDKKSQQSSEGQAGEAVGGGFGQQDSQAGARGGAQPVGHDAHAQNEQGQSAQNFKNQKK